jgi:hypothetical protein
MAEIDYVIPALKITQEGIFNLRELYRFMKKWFDENRYDFLEKKYDVKQVEEGEFPKIKWVSEKKADDYTKWHIEVSIKGKNIKGVELKKEKAHKGTLNIKLEAYLEKDYDDRWEKWFWLKFLRTCYDHLIIKGKLDKYADELSEETYDLFNKAKAFLRLEQYKE